MLFLITGTYTVYSGYTGWIGSKEKFWIMWNPDKWVGPNFDMQKLSRG